MMRRLTNALIAGLLGLLTAACGRAVAGPAVPDQSASAAQEVPATATQGPWQPPAPTIRPTPTELPPASPSPTAMPVPDLLVRYETYGFAAPGTLEITRQGEVFLSENRPSQRTLNPDETAYLAALCEVALHPAAGHVAPPATPTPTRPAITRISTPTFKTLPFSSTLDGPGVISDGYTITLWCAEGDHMRQIAFGPDEADQLATALHDLSFQLLARDDPPAEAAQQAIRIAYFYQIGDQISRLEIDAAGGVYADERWVGRLDEAEMAELAAWFAGPAFQRLETWYLPPSGERDYAGERYVSLSYAAGGQTRQINAVTGASVPPELQAMLERMARLYARWQ